MHSFVARARPAPLRLSLLAALGLGSVACAPKQLPADERYRAGDPALVLREQREKAALPGSRRALDNLDLASMSFAQGDAAAAEAALRVAVSIMTDFQADGEFAATLGAEQRKDWKGEPYEKMAAYLTLGLLLHAEGDRGNALAMYKSAILADTGTREERYRSDFVPAWVVQALAYQAEREPDNAAQALGRGVDAVCGRSTLRALSERLEGRGGAAEGADQARVLLYSALPAGVSAAARDPAQAAKATLSVASTLLLDQPTVDKDERLPGLQAFRARDFEAAGEALPAVAEAWMKRVAELPAGADPTCAAFAAEAEALLQDEPNVVILVERGYGPAKRRSGDYGEVLVIEPGGEPGGPLQVRLDGAPLRPLYLDSLSFQATTRGGRAVDRFLKGKAVFKDTALITGYMLASIADTLAHNNPNDSVAAVAGLVGLGLMIGAAVTNPAADIRAWSFDPEAWYLVAGRWSPGAHELSLGERSYHVNVPAAGQLVRLVPTLQPGGAVTLGAEGP